MRSKQEILGQYFTRLPIVRTLLNLLFEYKKYKSNIKILEPSFGTGNFIKGLKEKGFYNIVGCEIDSELTNKPTDFFNLPLKEKYDLIIGNPPFTKYNIKESYFYKSRYIVDFLNNPIIYLTSEEFRKDKVKVENAFILKSLKHLRDKNSTIGYVLPVSFFIGNKNKSVKEQLKRYFSTIVIYQNDQIWFDKHIPCCFSIFTNSNIYNRKIIVIFENKSKNKVELSTENIHEELIPQVIFHKQNGHTSTNGNRLLKDFLDTKIIHFNKSYKDKNTTASNILERSKIANDNNIDDYKIAVVRVGNSSVGKSGLINIKKDILNDMFYVFDVKEEYKKDKELKEQICEEINRNIHYFRSITCRVGSKSIKKEDIYNLKIFLNNL